MAKEKKESLYQQIENYVINLIESGKLDHNSKIPSESELCGKFDASRMTVNKALTNLSNAGYIERIPGRGSFVKSFRVEKKIPEMISFSEELNRVGIVSTSKLLHYSVVNLTVFPEIARKLDVDPEELIHHFVRLRCGDGKPLAVSYNYVLVKVVPMLDINCLQKSFYGHLEDTLKLDLGYNDTVIQVVKPTEEMVKALGITGNSDVVKSSHVSYLSNNEPFEYTETFYNSKQYSFHYRCYKKQ